jgi:hypothetical protein
MTFKTTVDVMFQTAIPRKIPSSKLAAKPDFHYKETSGE